MTEPLDPTRRHPDETVEAMLRILGRTAQALARVGAAEHARERFRQGLQVGRNFAASEAPAGAGSIDEAPHGRR